MFYLEKKDLKSYLLGSLFFGAGGGFSYIKHLQVAKKVFQKNKKIIIKSLNEFSDDDFLVSAYGVGDPSRAKTTTAKEWQKAIFIYEQKVGQKIKGVVPGEIGAEFLAMQAAVSVNLPVVDADLVGGRAAPEINLDCFGVFKKLITPVLCVLPDGKSIFLEGNFNSKEIENISRVFFDQGGGSGILVGYGCRANDLKKIIISKTLSRTKEIGECLKKKDLALIINQLKAKIIFSGKIKKVKLESSDGFYVGNIFFEKYRMTVKNENISFFSGQKLIAQAPELIILLDENLKPIHNSEMNNNIGNTTSLLVAPADGYWQQARGREMWDELISSM
jgi:DUF917 family protein